MVPLLSDCHRHMKNAFFIILIAFSYTSVADLPERRSLEEKKIQWLSQLSIEDARQRALAIHPKIAAARLRELASKESFKVIRGNRFPVLTGNAVLVGADGDNERIAAGSGINNPIIYNRGAFGINLAWQLMDFGRTSHSLEAARLSSLASGQAVAETKANVALWSDSAFLDSVRAGSIKLALDKAVEARKTMVDQIRAMVTNGLRSELDLGLAESSLAETVFLRSKAANDEMTMRLRLSTLLGLPDGFDGLLIAPTFPNTALGDISAWTKLALSSRPELRRLRFELETTKNLVKASKSEFFPVLNASAAVGSVPERHPRLEPDYLAGGLILNIPIFNGFRTEARVQESTLLSQAAAVTLNAEEDRILREVRIAALELSNASERFRLAQSNRDTVSKTVRLAELRLLSGSVSVAEISQAYLLSISADLNFLAARYEVDIARSRLQYESGDPEWTQFPLGESVLSR